MSVVFSHFLMLMLFMLIDLHSFFPEMRSVGHEFPPPVKVQATGMCRSIGLFSTPLGVEIPGTRWRANEPKEEAKQYAWLFIYIDTWKEQACRFFLFARDFSLSASAC
ncbi:hypothetical protein M5X00_23185 [Paenibacillus alvei]|uniref:Secreted protein n=1 Tax=Paenibacillus alvei TaxID=44250 RepID=A0ABT4H2E2_PAEAL|nr:hypothetical protein [Paenibacillus alvei]EJW14310.1 hypothetical protein PAV_14c00030 [Paenibacillus alvei DSM 29]MCY9540564.1 hypothetical protein [Paenibacillus alvei]MCY9737318.1 hypothetical protein [Paenibacillus alvei]MCY9757146.1 hypothetical protein [Paenibacillus alvei]MCY9763150.1 hypothetical protein [Paenibacillus alvei]